MDHSESIAATFGDVVYQSRQLVVSKARDAKKETWSVVLPLVLPSMLVDLRNLTDEDSSST
jgi:hypothetical protein